MSDDSAVKAPLSLEIFSLTGMRLEVGAAWPQPAENRKAVDLAWVVELTKSKLAAMTSVPGNSLSKEIAELKKTLEVQKAAAKAALDAANAVRMAEAGPEPLWMTVRSIVLVDLGVLGTRYAVTSRPFGPGKDAVAFTQHFPAAEMSVTECHEACDYEVFAKKLEDASLPLTFGAAPAGGDDEDEEEERDECPVCDAEHILASHAFCHGCGHEFTDEDDGENGEGGGDDEVTAPETEEPSAVETMDALSGEGSA